MTRARELLTDVKGQFQRAQQEFELAEKLERAKKIYQVMIEDSFAMLGGGGDPSRFPRRRSELNVDEEYLKRLKEVLEMRRDMMAELARILAEDPRLLQRYMALFKNRSTNLREQLANLAADQQNLNREVLAWKLAIDQRPRIAQILLQRQLNESAGLATKAGELQDKYQIWLPLARQTKDPDLQAASTLIQSTATAATEISAKATQVVSEMQRIKLKAPPAAASSTNSAGGRNDDGTAAKDFDEKAALDELRKCRHA